jgi:hypothetical protein
MNNYTPLLISRNDKNKQLTLLSQHKLALPGKIYVNGSVNLEGHLKKLKTKHDASSGLYLSIYVIKRPIQLVRKSLQAILLKNVKSFEFEKS